MSKENRGGKREGSGRPARNYPVKQMGIRVPEEVFDECVKACEKITKNFEKKLEKSLRNQK